MTQRDKKKDQTRSALAAAAIELFTERGYDTVTMAEVAKAVGVSRRTAFRYFPAKDDLMLEHPNQWMHVFNEFVEAHQHLKPSQRLREAAYAVASHIEFNPEPVIQLFALTFTHPALAAGYARTNHAWVLRVASELSASSPATTTPLAAEVLAAAYMGMVDTVCAAWARNGGSMTELFDQAFVALDVGLTAFD